jgi:hypothetical protein
MGIGRNNCSRIKLYHRSFSATFELESWRWNRSGPFIIRLFRRWAHDDQWIESIITKYEPEHEGEVCLQSYQLLITDQKPECNYVDSGWFINSKHQAARRWKFRRHIIWNSSQLHWKWRFRIGGQGIKRGVEKLRTAKERKTLYKFQQEPAVVNLLHKKQHCCQDIC